MMRLKICFLVLGGLALSACADVDDEGGDGGDGEADEADTTEEDVADAPPEDGEAFAVETKDVSITRTWDGVAPRNSRCWNDRRFVQSTHLRKSGNGQEISTIVYPYYSPICRTAWARLTVGAIAVPHDNGGGIAQIIRNSDGRTYTCNVTTTSGQCTTAMVNDAGVTSYAYGYEDAGAWTAWARTANY